jgi:hypothetical protein
MRQADDPRAFLFRGVTHCEYELIPSVARDFKPDRFPLRKLEDKLLDEFKRRALPWLATFFPHSDLEWLMVAQHHGVPTRLLDWTRNPLVALYFACLSHPDADGTIYVLNVVNKPMELPLEANPFTAEDLCYVRPPHISPRIFAQAACFTISRNPEKPLPDLWILKKITVKKDHKDSLRRELGNYGISEASLFPGLDGLARDLKQMAVDENSDFQR